MRLIKTTSLELKEFLGYPTNHRFPRHAILSHTWGEEEKKAGFTKIAGCCEIELDEGLTLAASTMYEASTICYAHLSDVGGAGVARHGDWRDSRWFTRGGIPRELVAPFEELKGEAGVARDVFLSPAVRREHSIAARMSWAKGRHTTRIEDRAYSLLGLFEIVNMPAVYGEGQQWFSRLHETIMNTQQDDIKQKALNNLDAHNAEAEGGSGCSVAAPRMAGLLRGTSCAS
ncbi:HET-domain-containing protein [Nemania serpens]|nr:HET-domain-containing protein [Nemania serpens]